MDLKIFEGLQTGSAGSLPLIPYGDSSLVYSSVDSSGLIQIPSRHKIVRREDFFGLDDRFSSPVLIGKSDFVSRAMVEHLMRNKKNSALGVKYQKGDAITNMEGALHTFATPVCQIYMSGDFKWAGTLLGKEFGNNRMRSVILSAAIHPDFEMDNVILRVVRAKATSIEGVPFDMDVIPSRKEKENGAFLKTYEAQLQKHMVYHLSEKHRLPAISEIPLDQILDGKAALVLLEQMIGASMPANLLNGKFLRHKSSLISLEMMYRIYVEQLQNEFKVLDPNLPQGYVYTISPPSIFAEYIGGASILNRLQALAFQSLAGKGLFSRMKVLAFSDYADKKMVGILQQALPDVSVMSQTALYDAGGLYAGFDKLALVIHNNSDAFGQNIETEGPTSLDGVIGSFSNAAINLKRDRTDLLDYIF